MAEICQLKIDEDSLPPTGPDMLHERRVAVFDLLEGNEFTVLEHPEGPYDILLKLEDDRLMWNVRAENETPLTEIPLGLQPFRRIVRDYFMVCESYHDAIRTATSARIEAIDMGRRGLHNEGSRLLQDRLSKHAELDFDTARRLFTVICSLHRRNVI